MKPSYACVRRVAYTISTLLLSLYTLTSIAEPASTSLVQVDSFSPEGEVKDVRQVVARFSEPMVAFGDPRLESPFTIDCPSKGNGHWIDARNWAYDFEHDLPAGLKCQFTLRNGLKSMAGSPVHASSYTFTTGGPSIRTSWPREGNRIDEQQYFLLGLDAEADLNSVREHASCAVDGIGENIPLTLIEGQQRQQVLNEQRNRASDIFEILTKQNRRGLLTVKNKRMDDMPTILVAQCARPLPPDATVNLIWGAGIQTPSGIATKQNQTLPFSVRSDFIAKMHCTRLTANAGCVPVLPITLEFTAPLPRERADKIILRTQDGQVIHPKLEDKTNTIQSLSFEGPFRPLSTVTIEMPHGMIDDSLRKLSNNSAFPMSVRIDDDPPLIKFSSHFGILEAHAQPALPVSVRNVEATLKGVSTYASTSNLSRASSAAKQKQHPAKPNQTGTLARIDTSHDEAILSWLRHVMNSPEDSDVANKTFQKRYQRYPREGEIPLLHGHEKEFQAQPLNLPVPSAGKALELIGIPMPKLGFYVVEFASNRLGSALFGEPKPYYAYSSALVTNLSVHFKKGRESSLAWVTRLDNAQPVEHAHVRVSDCSGKLFWEGHTDVHGIAHIQQELPDTDHCNKEPRGLLVTARKDDDLSFMLSSWNQGINRWEFNLSGGRSGKEVIAHTVLDRPLFRAGETVSMKHFIRLPTGKGFALPEHLPTKAEVRHNGSDQTYDIPLQWNNTTGFSTWNIPKEAKLGTYSIQLKSENNHSLTSGSFRVEQFRVPLMRAVLKPPATPVINSSKAEVDAQLSYLSGGAAAGAPVKFRSRLVEHDFSFQDYDDFRFGGKAPKEGIAAVEPYSYDPENDDETVEEDPNTNNLGYPVRTRSLMLDGNGGTRIAFNGIPKSADPRALEVEMEYSDPNGQHLTSSTRVLVLPSSLVLGIRTDSREATKDRLAFKVLALDYLGKIQTKRSITVDAYRKTTYSYRKRLLGGFYAYEQTEEVKYIGQVCKGATDQRGLLICNGAAPDTGELVLVAKATDDQGHTATAADTVDIASEDNWYTASSSDRIDILPNKRAYEPGETARFEVRMPFREATALVTVEREGILNSWVTPISAKSPFVDVPILEHYGPNAYISVMVVRGRIDPESSHSRFSWLRKMMYRIGMFLGIVKDMPKEMDTHPTALVDLTKPAFKLGITQVRVGWNGYTLKVKVEPERSTYKVRDHAAVNISVTNAAGQPASHAEIALAAVDEGLLALSPAKSWDLLEAMMERRSLEVDTSTAQSQVIGKRHFGKKAAAPGGGGGSANARELFDTLLLWKPSIQLDAQGHARVEIPLNDSLTSFRIEAIAHEGTEKFGSGGTSVHTTQDVMLLAGLPPFVREGDHFTAMVTVRNGGEKPLTLDVLAQVSPSASSIIPANPSVIPAKAGIQGGGDAQHSLDSRLRGNDEKNRGNDGRQTLPAQRISIEPGKATEVHFPYTVPFDTQKLDWTISAQEVNSTSKPARDALKFVQTVGAAYPVRVYQQTLEQLEPGKPWSFPAQLPVGAIAGRGGLDIILAQSLGGNVNPIREWMTRYSYTCLEQQVSKAIALEDSTRWQTAMNSLSAYLDSDGLAKYFPTSWLDGSDTLTAYILSIAHDANLDIPEGPRTRMLKGLQDFVAGRINRHGQLQTADVVLRKIAAIDALARYNEANAKMLESLEIAPNLWPSSGVIDWLSILNKIEDIPERDKKLTEARQILRSRLMFSGTTLTFSTEKSDDLWWLMVSPDVNAVRALRLLVDDATFKADAPRLMRGALARQLKGRWNTTVANAWGVLALRAFQSTFEHDPVRGTSTLKLGERTQALDWAKSHSHATNDPTQGTPIGDGLNAHFNWPKIQSTMSLEHQGSGKPWAFVAARAALPLEKPLFAGYRITRKVTPVDQHKPNIWTRGDVYRVTLEIDAQTDMTWVVVNDPIPSGATILGSGLGGDSQHLTASEKHSGWAWPAFEERAFDGFRAYYAYVPKGHFKMEYTVRLNNPGRFTLPASRVEAMYAPEVFGELPVTRVEVE